MKEFEINNEPFLTLNGEDSRRKLIQNTNNIEIDDDDDNLVKSLNPNKSDIDSLIKKINKLPCCLNEFLKDKMKTLKGISQLLEIRRLNETITINISNDSNNIIICQYCMKNCCNYSHFLEKKINIDETNYMICSCGVDNHSGNYYLIQNNFKLNSDDKNEIDEIVEFCKDDESEKKIESKKKIKNLINRKNDETLLKIVCNMLNIPDIIKIFNSLNYDDNYIHKKILLCLKNNKKFLSYDFILWNYISNYFFKEFKDKEIPIYIFKDNFDNFGFDESFPVLYYYNPDIFSHSFFFQVYRKEMISKQIESNKCINFLRKVIKITNEDLCSNKIDSISDKKELFTYGFYTIESKLNDQIITKFEDDYEKIFIIVFINHLCEIFSDFIKNGCTKRVSLIYEFNKDDKSKKKNISKIFLEYIINNIFASFKDESKNNLIIYPLFKYIFYEENKLRIMTLLSSYSFSLSKQYNNFEGKDNSEIFNLIEDEIKSIVQEKKFRKKNDSQQNIQIVHKLINIYKLKGNNDINAHYLYNFNNLLQRIIDIDYPIKLANKALELIPKLNDNIKEYESLKIYLDYILKITLLCNTNIIGNSYIYNSNYIPKIIQIIKNLNFDDNSNFILEMLVILKICFNRKIIDVSFLNIKNMGAKMTLKEYLIDILFVNEPIVRNESIYDFSGFNKLLNRINTIYSFIFEKKNINLLPDSFDNINLDDSYLNIIKKISLNISKEFNQIKWKNKLNSSFLNLQREKISEINENFLEEKIIEIIEEIKNKKTKIPGFILLDILRCLENLNLTNFYLTSDNKSFLIDDKFDLISIIKNEKLPLAVKSLILNYLLKSVLCLKIDPNSNEINGPLVHTSYSEKNPVKNKIQEINGKYLITLESKESEKHLNETIKLINILIICIQSLNKNLDSLNLDKAFIEKNGLYNYCVSIIQALFHLSNLIINTNKIHELYLSSFLKLFHHFSVNKNLFRKIINFKEKERKTYSKKNFNNQKKNQESNQENMKKIFKDIEDINIDINIEKYIEKINSDLSNFSERKITSIYQSFRDYHKGNLNVKTDNHYSFILKKNENEEISIEELNEFNGISSNINDKILNNYKKWNQYINDESSKVKDFIEHILNLKRGTTSKRKKFYAYIFYYISGLGNTGGLNLNDHLFIKALLSIIITDEKFKRILEDEKMKLIINNYIDKNFDLIDFKNRIIGQIIKKIYFLANYELLISKCFSNTKQENELSDLLNCLILFLEILGERLNQFFHESMLKYKFDFSEEKDYSPVAKYDDESQTFKIFKEGVDENNIYSPFEVLLQLHQKIFESLKITNDDKYRETTQNNLLIIFNSLTYCIIEYTNLENPDYKPIVEKLYLDYFGWQRKDKSLNPIFQSINFEINHNMIKNEKYIFILNNILTLFIVYIKYGTKAQNENYFYKISPYKNYNPYLYLLHIFIYTSQIIGKKELTSKNSEQNIINSYKNGAYKYKQLFYIAQKYYEIIFLLKKYYCYKELKIILPDYDIESIDSYKIIDYYGASGIYPNVINDIMSKNDFINNLEDLSKYMDIIFRFWKTIFKDIEVFIEGKSQNIYFIIRPESLYLSDYEKKFYEDNIDYTSRDSKLMGIYRHFDSFLFEMIWKSQNRKRFNFAKIFSYFGFELINFIFYAIHNIILIIHYYKSWKEDYSKYNKIENNKSSLLLFILSGVHILYIIIVIINWCFNRLIIDYYHALTKYSIQNVNPKLGFKTQIKIFKEKKNLNNALTSFSEINNFFSDINGVRKIYIFIINTLILNPKIFPYLISLISLIFYYLFSEIFLIIPLLLLANLISTLSAIFKGLVNKLEYLIYLYSYTLIALYIFAWIGFLFLPNLFKFEVVNKNNEYIIDQNEEIIEEYICSSSIQCILYFLNFGLSSGGALDLNLISFKNNYGYYLRQFFFGIFFYLFINMIFSNIFLALITDAFSEMREKAWKNENDKKNVCFICDLSDSDCIEQNIEYKTHIQEHFKWKYVDFICKLALEENVELSKEEFYIKTLIKNRSIDWFPKKQDDNNRD